MLSLVGTPQRLSESVSVGKEYQAIAPQDSSGASEDEYWWAKAINNHRGSDPNWLAEECELVLVARSILERRRLRNDHFDPVIFGEPAWDMLLGLYVREASGASSTTAQLEEGLAIPGSAAARWLRHLETGGLVITRPHPREPATAFVELTAQGRQSLDEYLAALRESLDRRPHAALL